MSLWLYHCGSRSRKLISTVVLFLLGPTSVAKLVGYRTYCWGECKAVYQAPAPHKTCGSCWLGTAQQFYHDVCGEGGSRVTSKLKQEAHIDQPTAWPLSHICALPYHVGSGSHGQLFRPYWGSPVWHSSSYKNSLSKSLIQLCDSCQPNLITSVSINDI